MKKEPHSHNGRYGLIRRSRKGNKNSSLLLVGARRMKCPALLQAAPRLFILQLPNLLTVRGVYGSTKATGRLLFSFLKKTGSGVARFVFRTQGEVGLTKGFAINFRGTRPSPPAPASELTEGSGNVPIELRWTLNPAAA